MWADAFHLIFFTTFLLNPLSFLYFYYLLSHWTIPHISIFCFLSALVSGGPYLLFYRFGSGTPAIYKFKALRFWWNLPPSFLISYLVFSIVQPIYFVNTFFKKISKIFILGIILLSYQLIFLKYLLLVMFYYKSFLFNKYFIFFIVLDNYTHICLIHTHFDTIHHSRSSLLSPLSLPPLTLSHFSS